jgi:hypothetical protein
LPIDESPPDDDEPDELEGVQGAEEPVEGAPGLVDDEPPVELDGDGEDEPPPAVPGKPALPVLPPVLGMPVLPELPPVLGMPALLPELLLELLLELLPELLPELPVLGEPALPALPELPPELGEPALPESCPQPLARSVALTTSATNGGRTQRAVTRKAPTLNVFISFYPAYRLSDCQIRRPARHLR